MENSTLKNSLIGVLAIALAISLGYTFIHKPVKTENNVADIVKLDKQPAKSYVSQNGETHTQKQVINLSEDQKAFYQTQIDSLSKQLKVKPNQIAGVTTVTGKSDIDFTPNIKVIEDSLRKVLGSEIDYASRWFSMQGNTVTKEFKAQVRDSITLAFIKTHYGFLNLKDRISVDVSSANKDMKYENVRSWSVPDIRNNKAKLGFGITAGYGIQFRKNNDISYGPQITGGFQLRF